MINSGLLKSFLAKVGDRGQGTGDRGQGRGRRERVRE